MKTRQRLVPLAVALGLSASALVAAAPPATAAGPTCESAMMAVDSNKRILVRHINGNVIESQKRKANSMQSDIKSIVWMDSVKVSTGVVAHVNLFPDKGHPNYSSVTIPDSSEVLTVKTTNTFVNPSFAARSLTGSGRYYVYGISQAGNLTRWTRFNDGKGHYSIGDAKVVAAGMSGIRTLQYSWTYEINGKQTDFLIATTGTGSLKQIRIPWSAPANETVKVLATSGFSGTDGLSLSFCNDSDNYLSLVAVDNKTNQQNARWFTLYDLKHPKTSALVDRGLVEPEADWNLHAVT